MSKSGTNVCKIYGFLQGRFLLKWLRTIIKSSPEIVVSGTEGTTQRKLTLKATSTLNISL